MVTTMMLLYLVSRAALAGRSGKDHEGIVFGYVDQRYLAGQVNTLTILCLGTGSSSTWQVR